MYHTKIGGPQRHTPHNTKEGYLLKGHITVTVEIENYRYARSKGANISGICDKALESYRNQEIGQVHAINIDIKRKELAKLQEEKILRDQELSKRQQELEIYDKRIKEAEIQRLQQEKEILEKQSHCSKCNRNVDGPINLRGETYLLCIDCLGSMNKKELEKFRGQNENTCLS